MVYNMATSAVCDEELAIVRSTANSIAGVNLISCHREIIQAKIQLHSETKCLMTNMQFTEGYPSNILIVELKSKTLPDHLLRNMEVVSEQHLKKHQGKPQVLLLLQFLSDLIIGNPFIVCSDELSYIKKELCRKSTDEIKVKQKAGTINYKAIEGSYILDFKLAVPNEYPFRHTELIIKECNLPANLQVIMRGHAAELLRQCIEPPLRVKHSDPPFVPKPSLRKLSDYLVKDCLRRYPNEKCPVCNECALPANPKNFPTDEAAPKFVYSVYCGHLFHFSCLDSYMKTPPFTGGKKCLLCGQRIFHEKWKLPPRLAEERWAHQEARKREIAEVADFLGFD